MLENVAERHLLLIDADRDVARNLGDFLGRNGFQLAWAPQADEASAMLAGRPDLILMDNGPALCRELRAQTRTPIIMLSADAGDQRCIEGLRSGADDYLPKPFNPQVLLARIEAVLRRVMEPEATKASVGVRLDVARKTLYRGVQEVALTLSEYQLLAALMAQPGRCFTREELRAALGDGDPMGTSNRAIDIHVSRLRTKLEDDPRHPHHLVTVRGEGYRFVW